MGEVVTWMGSVMCYPNEGLFAPVTGNAVRKWSSAADPLGMEGLARSFSSQAVPIPA